MLLQNAEVLQLPICFQSTGHDRCSEFAMPRLGFHAAAAAHIILSLSLFEGPIRQHIEDHQVVVVSQVEAFQVGLQDLTMALCAFPQH